MNIRRIPTDIAEIVDFIAEKNVYINCTKIRLFRNKNNNAEFFEGPGFIRCDDDGKYLFQVFSTHTNVDEIALSQEWMGVKSGEMIPEGVFFSLTARSMGGELFLATDIFPKFDWADGSIVFAIGGLRKLDLIAEKLSDRYSMDLVYMDDVKVPSIEMSKIVTPDMERHVRNTSRFEAVGVKFLIRKYENYLLIRAISDEQLPDHFEMRVSEAIRFLTAMPHRPRIVIEEGDTERRVTLYSDPQMYRGRRMMYPPVCPYTEAWHNSAWPLFVPYLDYTVNSTKGSAVNYSSYHLDNALEASQASLDAAAIGMSVAIEGLASLVQKPFDKNQREHLEKLRDSIVSHIDGHCELRIYKDRIDNLLGMLFNTRVQDKVYYLANVHKAYASDIRAWSDVRNKFVHPKYSKSYYKGARKVHITLAQYYRETVLMYHIIFSVIGFTESFTDYATPNFPSRNYPLTSSER
ncbi:hypothetical protein [Methylobacterium sp. 17Sr1-1]|uniref:hypothetical protein n=1 Tax=Methylobacterium sp. 17Sr1-1 TaxID=2202826 RepID=UPI0013A5A2BC|nr:hypothetical protein [Methylobacterium sp. 17Sr1-1]